MNILEWNVLDWAVVAVLAISGLLALARGFVREALSVAGWVAAAFAAIAAFPALSPILREWIGVEWVADVIAASSVFVVVLVAASVLSGFVAARIHNTEFKAADRSLGFLFGLLRGAVLVCLAYLLAVWVFPPDQEPEMMREAKSRPIVARGAAMLASLVPDDMRGSLPLDEPLTLPDIEMDPPDVLTLWPGNESSGQGAQASDADPSDAPATESGDTEAVGQSAGTGPGYSPEEREELDKLINEQTE